MFIGAGTAIESLIYSSQSEAAYSGGNEVII